MPKTKRPSSLPPIDQDRKAEYTRRMIAAETAAEASRKGLTEAVAVKVMRRVPGRDIQVDQSLFTNARAKIREDSIANLVDWPLYIYGSVGIGKTFLAASIYMDWPGDGSVIWMPYTLFCERCDTLRINRELCITDGFKNFEFSYESWWQYFSDAALVVIDDFGVGERGVAMGWRNEWVIELLERRHKKPLVITGNLSLQNTDSDLPTIYGVFDDRVVSRLREGRPVRLHGKDLRSANYHEEWVE